jgi:hypothetical protein
MNAEELDKESLSQTDSLQPPPQRRTFGGLGTAGATRWRAARGVQVAALSKGRYIYIYERQTNSSDATIADVLARDD